MQAGFLSTMIHSQAQYIRSRPIHRKKCHFNISVNSEATSEGRIDSVLLPGYAESNQSDGAMVCWYVIPS
jgi:hypothetical protein